jgi:hypothetical protein
MVEDSDDDEWATMSLLQEDGKVQGLSQKEILVKQCTVEWQETETILRESMAKLRKHTGLLEVLEPDKSQGGVYNVPDISIKHNRSTIQVLTEMAHLGVSLEVQDRNMYHWTLTLSNFDQSTRLGRDMAILESTYGIDEPKLTLEVEFNMYLWPFYPPKVTPIYPRLQSRGLGKLITMDDLTLSKWNPLNNVAELVQSIRSKIMHHASVDIPGSAPDTNARHDTPIGAYPFESHLWRLCMLTGVPARQEMEEEEDILAPSVRRQKSQEEKKLSTWGQQAQGGHM